MTKLFLLLSLSAALPAQVTLTGFGSADFTDAGSSGTFTQTDNVATFMGTDSSAGSNRFQGLFSVKNITGYADTLHLLGTLTGPNPGTPFTVYLFDGAIAGRSYSGNWASFTPGVAAQVILPLSGANPAFNQSSVSAVIFTFGGAGSGLQFTFDNLHAEAAIPEPSAYALLVGAMALAVVAARRFRLGAR